MDSPTSAPPSVAPSSAQSDEALARASDILQQLADSRDRATVLETGAIELAFTGPRESGSNPARKAKVLRRIAVSFGQRQKGSKRSGRSVLILQIRPAHADGQSAGLTLRVDVAPNIRNKLDPSLISLTMVISKASGGAADADADALARAPVTARFELMAAADVGESVTGEEPGTLLSNVQSLGPMLSELQSAWFQPRERSSKPKNVEFRAGTELSEYWVASTSDDNWLSWQPRAGAVDSVEEAGRFLASLVIWRSLAALYVGDDDERRAMRQLAGLPEPEEFFPKRPVDLNPSEVRALLAERKLRVPWHVIEAACTSLNAGKHVIFTGPPGCGKTELAVELALFATKREREGLLVTASPAWSASELIGRYIPRHSSYGLDFAPGFFLRAIRDRRWLIIDEFNRAPIDACFGELFTVLSGQSVELPFDEFTTSGAGARVRVLPAVRDGSVRGSDDDSRAYSDYVVPSDFRIIGTMNDADRSELSRLSFALLRRFDIIRVDAPASDELAKVIDDTMETAKRHADIQDRGYIFKGTRGGAAVIFDGLRDVFMEVFAGSPGRTSAGSRVNGLVTDRVVGVATARDVIAFIAEGLRAPATGAIEDRMRRCAFKKADEADAKYHPRNLARSYFAMALVLKVYPQLEALDAQQRHAVIERLTAIFKDNTFLRVEPTREGGPEDCSFEIVSVQAGYDNDLDGDSVLSIPEYLIDEIRRQLHGTGEEEQYADLLARLANMGNDRDEAAQ